MHTCCNTKICFAESARVWQGRTQDCDIGESRHFSHHSHCSCMSILVLIFIGESRHLSPRSLRSLASRHPPSLRSLGILALSSHHLFLQLILFYDQGGFPWGALLSSLCCLILFFLICFLRLILFKGQLIICKPGWLSLRSHPVVLSSVPPFLSCFSMVF